MYYWIDKRTSGIRSHFSFAGSHNGSCCLYHGNAAHSLMADGRSILQCTWGNSIHTSITLWYFTLITSDKIFNGYMYINCLVISGRTILESWRFELFFFFKTWPMWKLVERDRNREWMGSRGWRMKERMWQDEWLWMNFHRTIICGVLLWRKCLYFIYKRLYPDDKCERNSCINPLASYY